jgi:hypothetical protein
MAILQVFLVQKQFSAALEQAEYVLEDLKKKEVIYYTVRTLTCRL